MSPALLVGVAKTPRRCRPQSLQKCQWSRQRASSWGVLAVGSAGRRTKCRSRWSRRRQLPASAGICRLEAHNFVDLVFIKPTELFEPSCLHPSLFSLLPSHPPFAAPVPHPGSLSMSHMGVTAPGDFTQKVTRIRDWSWFWASASHSGTRANNQPERETHT